MHPAVGVAQECFNPQFTRTSAESADGSWVCHMCGIRNPAGVDRCQDCNHYQCSKCHA